MLQKKLFIFYWKYRWRVGYKWIKEVRSIFLEEAKEFLAKKGFLKDRQSIERLAKKWPSYVKSLFNPSSPERFYLNWKEEIGLSNIAANILDQFSRPYIASMLIRLFGQYHQFTGTLLDFGCGTAAISLSWQRKFANHPHLLLSDVENLPRDFIRYYIQKYSQYKIDLVDVDLKDIPDSSIDSILCIDVLEHLLNPTAVFRLLDSKLKSKGILILEASWGGYHEHLKEAPIDWNKNGGKKLLNTGYIMLEKMRPYISLSAVYIKK